MRDWVGEFVSVLMCVAALSPIKNFLDSVVILITRFKYCTAVISNIISPLP